MPIDQDIHDLEAATGAPWGDAQAQDAAVQGTIDSDMAGLFPTPDAGDVERRAVIYLAARADKEALDRQLSDANKSLDGAETDLLRAMDRAKILAAKVDGPDGVVTVSAGEKAYHRLGAGMLDDPTVVEWVNASGGADILKQTINHMTFRKFCRELAETGKPIHPAVQKTLRRAISVRKG